MAQSDLKLLHSEIENKPYAQSIRALYLYGTHKLNPDNYSEVLSETAAYTTDKKNIYQFINRNATPKSEVAVPVETCTEETVAVPNEEGNVFTEIVSEERPAPKEVRVNGELNRILFEGEEDFLEREQVTIDLEQSKESGVIVTQPVENKAVDEEKILNQYIPLSEPEVTEIASSPDVPEYSADEDESSEVKKQIKNSPQETEIKLKPEPNVVDTSLNFHGTAEFLPEVKIYASPVSSVSKPVAEPLPTKHELEMQRLIAEVEEKMKKRRRSSEAESETVADKGLDFAEVQEFEVKDADKEKLQTDEPDITEPEKETSKTESDTAEVPKTHSANENRSPSGWQPINFSGNTPDALIKKTEKEPKELKKETLIETEKQVSEPAATDSAFNISFFTQEVTSLETEAADELIRDIKDHIDSQETEEASNVPVFINTWQKWLKIERTPETPQVSKEEEKNKVIENFIVKEPKISKLKEETDFVVKDRGDNISHLMTETLAKLYMDQKLYAKAIKAYETLTEKYPDKKSHFAEQIKLIKELRQNR